MKSEQAASTEELVKAASTEELVQEARARIAAGDQWPDPWLYAVPLDVLTDEVHKRLGDGFELSAAHLMAMINELVARPGVEERHSGITDRMEVIVTGPVRVVYV